MKSFIKISMLLGAASFLVTGSANARGMIVNDEYNGLPQEVTEQQNVAVEQVTPVEHNAPVEQNIEQEQNTPVAQDEPSVQEQTQAQSDEPAEQVQDGTQAAAVSNEINNETTVVAVNEIAVTDKKSEDKQEQGDNSNVAVSEAKPEDDTFDTASISLEDLDQNRGAYNPNNASYLLGTSSNNSVNNSVTGGNVISEGAFNSSSGLVNVIQNSGNNVLIQSSTIVNVQMIQ